MRKTAASTALRILIYTVCILLSLVLLFCAALDIGYRTYKYERWQPPSDSALSDSELLRLVSSPDITDAEYDIIYRQTGLTRIGVLRVLENSSFENILTFRDSFFGDHELVSEEFSPLCNQIGIERAARMVYLEDGDIIVSSSTNFSFWEIGHSAMVLDARRDILIEAFNPDEGSHLSDSFDLMTRPDFIVLRPKIDKETLKNIVAYTRESLLRIPYDPTVGVLSPKNPEVLTGTHCAHIIWYAYMHYGIDIDSNGGAVVTPRDIANSEYFEVVQVFGFDPDALWR